jgi:NAD(P)-dependent dehydrogenase (short-subunit alcohol dehydrogenase family)
MGELDGRVALVTGASRGIGEEIARRFAAGGAAVAVSARTVSPGDSQFAGSISETVDAITGAGGTAVAIAADLAKAEDRTRVIEATEKELGPIDILVNNAAVTWFEKSETFNERHYDLMFEVQVKAAFNLAQLVIPSMRERGAGWILNLSSMAGRHPQGPPYTPRRVGAGTVYGMCKAAIERFSTGLASELYADGIAVNVLSPSGVIATPGVLHHGLIPKGFEDRAEPIGYMGAAAYALCSGDPAELTGRIAYSKALVEELGLDVEGVKA